MTAKAESTVNGRHPYRQVIKEISLELWRDGAFYLVLSFFLMLLIQYTSGFISNHINTVFFENLAPGSITLLFSLGAITSAIIMLIFGPHDEQKKWNHLFYRYTVFPLVNTGKALTITGAGMTGGLLLACLAGGQFKDMAIALIFFAMFILYQLTFHYMQYVVRRGFGPKVSKCTTNYLLAAIIVIAPCLYIWAIYGK